MKNIKSIIFDLGVVLLNIDYQKTIIEFDKLGISKASEFYSKKIQNNIYTFGSELDTNWFSGGKKFSQGTTNLGLVLDHIKSNKNKNSAGSVIITDGQANLGKELGIESKGSHKSDNWLPTASKKI